MNPQEFSVKSAEQRRKMEQSSDAEQAAFWHNQAEIMLDLVVSISTFPGFLDWIKAQPEGIKFGLEVTQTLERSLQ